MTQKITLGILSESRLFREIVSIRLALENEIELVCAASTVLSLLARAEGRAIEVLLVYASLESLRGIDVIWEAKAFLPATRVVVVGFGQSEEEIARWFDAGAVYLGHDAPYETLLTAIRSFSFARQLGIRQSTVKSQVVSILKKRYLSGQRDVFERAEEGGTKRLD